MADPREKAIRSALTMRVEKVIKRRRYDERQIVQILRISPDKAQALLKGELDSLATSEIERYLNALD